MYSSSVRLWSGVEFKPYFLSNTAEVAPLEVIETIILFEIPRL